MFNITTTTTTAYHSNIDESFLGLLKNNPTFMEWLNKELLTFFETLDMHGDDFKNQIAVAKKSIELYQLYYSTVASKDDIQALVDLANAIDVNKYVDSYVTYFNTEWDEIAESMQLDPASYTTVNEKYTALMAVFGIEYPQTGVPEADVILRNISKAIRAS